MRGGARRGMTLIELMLGIALLALLSAAVADRYRVHVLQARRAEGMTWLKGIYLAQTAHEMEKRHYAADFEELGFEITGARALDRHTLRGRDYTFTLHAFDHRGRPKGNFRAVASADLDASDPMLDILMIENELTILE